ncbi:flagellar FlbD family protein [Georgenia sp. AZ-5]|uniref:flagellar FlbD family protein n=1 Tax=Georgenia sp. AZ-5 TaxID=3367526 RepID=UPI0037542849
MIVLTGLNKQQFAINPDLIERILVTPDTMLVMVDGNRYAVLEAMPEVIALVEAWRAGVITRAREVSVKHRPEHGHLGVVRTPDDAADPSALARPRENPWTPQR